MFRSRFVKFLDLSPKDRRLFIEAWFLILGQYIALSVISRRKVAAKVRLAASGVETPRELDIVSKARSRLALLDRAARNHVIPANCLVRALAGKVFLAREGMSASMRIGVARAPGGELHAHAWLEVGGAVVSDREDVVDRFSVIQGIGLAAEDVLWR